MDDEFPLDEFPLDEILSEHHQNSFRQPGPEGKSIPIQEHGEKHFRTGVDGRKSFYADLTRACSCLCFLPPSGLCKPCIVDGSEGIICVECFHHCSGSDCGVGICLEHSFEIEEPIGEIKRLCPDCKNKLMRKKRIRLFLKLLIFPPYLLFLIFFRAKRKKDELLPPKQIQRHPIQPTHPRHGIPQRKREPEQGQ